LALLSPWIQYSIAIATKMTMRIGKRALRMNLFTSTLRWSVETPSWAAADGRIPKPCRRVAYPDRAAKKPCTR